MGNPERVGKQSLNSGSNKLSASVELKFKNSKITNPEVFMEETNDLNSETLAENVGVMYGNSSIGSSNSRRSFRF